MDLPLYLHSPARAIHGAIRSGRGLVALAAVALAAIGAGGCKKKSGAQLAADPDEAGKLRRIAQRLEEAYGKTAMPAVKEPESFSDRLSQWSDFRDCTVRTYAARKRDADMKARDGIGRPTRHASIGEETVEECAVQSAVINKDPAMCERLALDFRGPSGELPMSAARCWDTRARVLGLPDECPVLWQPEDLPARNPECLALARRDASLCLYADSPGRCRALVAGDSASCGASDAAEDCPMALAYWKGLVPAGFGPPLIAPEATKKTEKTDGDDALGITMDLRWKDDAHPRIRITGPRTATGISWPGGKAQMASTEDTTSFWGAKLPIEAAQVGWRAGAPAVKVAFIPAGGLVGVRPLQPPGPSAGATAIFVWPDPQSFRRCQPGPETTGDLRFEAKKAEPGGIVEVRIDGKRFACSDGTQVDVEGRLRLVILDVR